MKYGEGRYGAAGYGPGKADAGGDEAQPVDLLSRLPPQWREGEEMQALQGVMGWQAGRLRAWFDGFVRQLTLETATWGLDYWERAFGLETEAGKSYAFRRERVKAKLRGAGTTTRQALANVASAFANGEAEVVVVPEEYRFVIKFVGVKGIPANIKGLEEAVVEAKPAHLAFSFEYLYNVWNNLKTVTWTEAAGNTWDRLRIL